jgi:hypothetical protein
MKNFLKKLFKKKIEIKFVDNEFLQKEYEIIKNKLENVMSCIGENNYYEIWIGLNKVAEVSMTLDGNITRIDYFGEKTLVRK